MHRASFGTVLLHLLDLLHLCNKGAEAVVLLLLFVIYYRLTSLQTGILMTALPQAFHCGILARTGQPTVSLLGLDEIGSTSSCQNKSIPEINFTLCLPRKRHWHDGCNTEGEVTSSTLLA